MPYPDRSSLWCSLAGSIRRLGRVALASALAVGALAAPVPEAKLELAREVGTALSAQLAELDGMFSANRSLSSYRKAFEAALPGRPGPSLPAPVLGRRLAEAEVVVLGDFHCLAESQARAARLLAAMAKGGARTPTLVVEWVDRDDQAALDDFLAGRIESEAFRKKVEFDRLWGFSWPAYRKMLEAARKLGARVLAFDSLRDKAGLGERDRAVTRGVLADRKDRPGERYLVVYGVYHVAGRGHLGERLAEAFPGRTLRIVDEAPEAWYRAAGEGRDRAELVAFELGKDLVYVGGASPVERDLAARDHALETTGAEEDELETELPLDRPGLKALVRDLRP